MIRIQLTESQSLLLSLQFPLIVTLRLLYTIYTITRFYMQIILILVHNLFPRVPRLTALSGSFSIQINTAVRNPACDTVPSVSKERIVIEVTDIGSYSSPLRSLIFSHQCFDTVGWATGRASGL